MSNYQISAVRVIKAQIKGLESLEKIIDEKFNQAIEKILNIKGRVILSGIGKSGFIANKISATLASTGTPAFFVNPNEASHGDLGMITKDDLVILLSNSGETKELKDIIFYCKKFNIPLFSMVRNPKSLLVEQSKISFILDATEEGNAVNAPMTSALTMLSLGDAIASALIEAKNFTNDKYGVFHPGGKLGSQFIKVQDLMRRDQQIPCVHQNSSTEEILLEITAKSLGCCAVLNDDKIIVGIITDGDLRRAFNQDFMNLTAQQIMTKNPILIDDKQFALKATEIMKDKKITSLFVTNGNIHKGGIVGVIHIHDCLRGL
jgi:arabinose-5-phosphate isomerase